MVVPPRSEAIVPARFVESAHTKGLAILEPCPKFQGRSQLLIARTLISNDQVNIFLRLLNPTEHPRTVYKDSIAAYGEPVEEIQSESNKIPTACCIRNQEPRDDQESTDAVPEHLSDLLERCSENVDKGQKAKIQSLLVEFADVFSAVPGDIGRTGIVKHNINTENASPIRQPARRLPIHRREEARKEIAGMLQRGIIEPSSSPWASPIVMVKKRDGSTRFCIDYRKLNEVTTKDSYPLPRIDDSLDALAGSQWFSTLDLSSGYWQVEVQEEDRPKNSLQRRNRTLSVYSNAVRLM